MTVSLAHACLILMKRDYLLAYRYLGNVMHPVLFFILVVLLFPLA